MTETVFFSWQADTPVKTGRNYLERALEKAVARISSSASVEDADRGELSLDRDTKDVPGQPPIVETIFRKIDSAAVFVPDLTFVGKRTGGRPTPNPNVLIEYGWALKSLGHGRIVPVMNIAHGRPEGDAMPFDMRHLRHPIQYELADNADEETRKAVRERLAKDLEGALRAVLDRDELIGKREGERDTKPFVAMESVVDSPARFRLPGLPLGMSMNGIGSTQVVDRLLSPGRAIWLRVMPTISPGRTWSCSEIKKFATPPGGWLSPLLGAYRDFDYVQADDGFGIVPVWRDKAGTSAVTFAFVSGEVWSIDTYIMNAVSANKRDGQRLAVPLLEGDFKRALLNYSRFLERLAIERPHRWIAGIESIRGAGLALGGLIPAGACVSDVITSEGTFEVGAMPKDALRPFFELVFDRFGLERPANLDDKENP